MFRSDAGGLVDAEVHAAQAFADVATIAIVHHRTLVDAEVLGRQLAEALNSRIIIEQAKGKISEAAHVDVDQAFERLRRHARSHHLHLADLARDIAMNVVSVQSLDRISTSRREP
jgi:AmiR/NasT family two-component response regulator